MDEEEAALFFLREVFSATFSFTAALILRVSAVMCACTSIVCACNLAFSASFSVSRARRASIPLIGGGGN